MKTIEQMQSYGYEQVSYFYHAETGLKAIVAIHNTVLGPALGGSRFWNYESEEEALEDVLRLSRGMTYKNALAGLNLGGGKAVIVGDPAVLKEDPVRREAFWRAFGRFIEGMGGRYITAEDVGTSTGDMAYINMETDHVVGLAGGSGDPSPYTARGVFESMKACCRHVYGSEGLKGKTVAVQGLGYVGYYLCEYLYKVGAKLVVCDIDQEKVTRAVEEFGAKVVGLEEIYGAKCDVFAPCALGAVINDDTIAKLKCKIVCGAANNVLKDATKHGAGLKKKGVTYAVDYLANAGGVTSVSYELSGEYDERAVRDHVAQIGDRMLAVLAEAEMTGRLAHEVADEMAERRIEAVGMVGRIFY
ncbi:leucine dehydrogenase [Candidatus Saccharibacteria bacterium]|nr:leucine dehydrogenase [Candidatus Saccharibacteria bacterium]